VAARPPRHHRAHRERGGVEQLRDLLDATTLELDAEAVKRLDEASA